MKIVIDIDDEDYKRIQGISDVFNSLTSRAYSAIRNGTPLPEGAEILTKEAYSDLCRRAADVPETNVGDLPSARLETHEKRTETHACDCISRQAAEALFRNARKELMEKDRKKHIKDFNTRDLMLLNAEQLIHLLPSVTSGRSDNPERNRPESIKYCEECDHIEMCSWYPTDGCEWLKTDRYNAGYNAAKEEIALSGEYERAYQRGFEAGRKSEWTTVAESEDKE